MIDFNAAALAPCIAAFGQSVVYQPAVGAPVNLTGIFNAFAAEEKFGSDGEMSQEIRPTLAINIADLPAGLALPSRRETVTVAGKIYEISEPMPDNFGQLLLKLRELTP